MTAYRGDLPPLPRRPYARWSQTRQDPARRALLRTASLAALIPTGAALTACSGRNRDPLASSGQNGPDNTAQGTASDGGAAGAPLDAAAPITVGLTYIPNVQFCAFYLGVEQKLFGDLDLRLRHHGEQEGLFEALHLGREQIVYASADEAAVAGGVTSVATCYQTYPGEVMIAGSVAGLGDLAGRSLGIPGRFGSSYYAALLALHTAGLTEQDVNLVEIGYTAVSALATGAVDAILGFVNNELVQLESQKVDVTSVPIAPEQTLVGPSLVTLPEHADDPVIATIVDGMAEAERRVITDPDAALAATARQVPALADPVQKDNARAVLEATMPLWKDADGEVSLATDDQAAQRMTTFLREAGILDAASTDGEDADGAAPQSASDSGEG